MPVYLQVVYTLVQKSSTRAYQFFEEMVGTHCARDKIYYYNADEWLIDYDWLRPAIVGSESRKRTGFPLCRVETHTRLWLLSFC